MKVSRAWLSDFVDWIETDPEVIADRLTRGMGEVEEIIKQGEFLAHTVVGEVLSIDKHPDADKLRVCTVQTDRGTKSVVCGGTNLTVGMLVAFAHVGATVKWHGGETMTLTQVKIRGVASEGMICAAEELGLEGMYTPNSKDGERPIMALKNLKVGIPLREALGMSDVVFHIDNHAITNRPDLFSHRGVARELVAMGLATWKSVLKPKKIVFAKTPARIRCINDIPDLVPRYLSCTIAIDSTGTTPDWMKRRLEACGYRSINLPVDITNYVSLELGMPLHSFDADEIDGDVHFRVTKKGESITTLDKVSYKLPEGAIVLSDKKGIFDLMGIMGGLRSSTKESTKNIYLHAAIVDPVSIRKAVTATGNRTEASTVYEKGIPRIAAEQGFMRALELILEHVPGATVTSAMESWGKEESHKTVKISVERITDFIGIDITTSRIKKILTDLGCTVAATKASMTVKPPLWRRDLTHVQDIIEEVARIFGYANVTPAMPEASITPPDRETRIHAIRDSLSQSGAFEMLHLAFTSPAQLKKWNLNPADAVTIENPIGEEVSLMRTALLPSLVETAAEQLKHTDADMLTVYEVGNVFRKGDEHGGLTLAVLPRGETTVKNSPLLRAKADLARALAAAGYAATIKAGTVPLKGVAHEGRSAEIFVNGTLVGHLFELHPSLIQSLRLPERTAVATLGFHKLLTLPASVTIAKTLPMFPSVTFDETIPLTQKDPYAAMVKRLSALDPLLENIAMVDVYEGASTKTMTLRFTYRSPEKTLKQEEVEKVHKKVVAELKK